ncbi:MFS transporter [Kocuria dechangensis]|uniref:MFS transporter n=1 Tax=Kocuria dechangensis TaxID=1176249 RepID=A0A917GG61_9MICC|nr:MFS transporter [Kocuria dechangensis]
MPPPAPAPALPAAPSGTAGTGPALLVVAAGVVAALHVWKLAPALPGLSAELGLSLVQAGFLLSTVQVAGMLLGTVVGLFGDRIGLRRGLLLGLGLLTTGSVLGLLSTGYGTLLGSRVLEGVGFMLVSICAPALIRRTVAPGRVSLLVGLWGCHIPVAAALSLLLGGLLSEALGWRAWWGAAAACSLGLGAVVLAVLPPDPAHAVVHGVRERLGLTLRSPGPWLVALVFGLYTAQWNGVVQFLPSMYAEAGIAATAAAGLSALAAGVNVVGNVAAGRALQRGVRPVVLWVVGFAVLGLAAVVAFGLAPYLDPGLRFGARYGAVLVFSAVGGVVPTTAIASLMRVAPTPTTVATSLGLGQQLNALGQFAGPPAVAAVAQATGTWDATWTVTGALALAGIAAALVVSRRLPAER